MNLQRYFSRIRYDEPATPDFATLSALQRAHVCAVAFENLDVQLRRPLTTSVEAAYRKIVCDRRGGWCYEQNGVFGWALSQVGFQVTRIAASVMRQQRGDAAAASHLCLLAEWPGAGTPYLVDVGFGGSLLSPIPLTEGVYKQAPFTVGLKRLDDGHWRFWEDLGDGEFCYDFMVVPASEAALSKKCASLQNDPASSFVLNLVAQLRTEKGHKALRGRVLTLASADGTESRVLESATALTGVLEQEFGLRVPEIADLWPGIVRRHETVFPGGTNQPG